MDFSKLSSTEQMAVIASAIVLVLGIVSLVNDWGSLLIVPVLAALISSASSCRSSLRRSTSLPRRASSCCWVERQRPSSG